MNIYTDKVTKPNQIELNSIINDFKKISINQLMPKSENTGVTKRILDCTLEDMQNLIFDETSKLLPIVDRLLKLYRRNGQPNR